MSNPLHSRAQFRSPMLVIALIGGALVTALGMNAMVAQPTRVAVVRMSFLLDNLAQDTEDRAVVDAMQEKAKTDIQAKLDELNKRTTEARAIIDAVQRETSLDKLNLDTRNLRYDMKLRQDDMMLERSLRFEQLYKAISINIDEMAKTDGYDLVIVDDSRDQFKPDAELQMPESLQRVRQLASRRVLYSGPSIDITEPLVVKMNNAFKAKGR